MNKKQLKSTGRELKYTLAFKCTKETKLRTFQFKFLHRRIATNYFLLKIGISSNSLCSFCNKHTETLEHLFWSCPFTQTFWKNVFDWIKAGVPSFKSHRFSMSASLGLIQISDLALINHILLIATIFIFVKSEAMSQGFLYF